MLDLDIEQFIKIFLGLDCFFLILTDLLYLL